MVQIVFDLVLLLAPGNTFLGCGQRLVSQFGSRQFQRYKVIKFVIVDAAPSPIHPHERCFIALVYSKGGLTVAV